MLDLILKWFFLGMIILFPLVLYSAWELYYRSRSEPQRNHGLRFCIGLASWFIGFILSHLSLIYHQSHSMSQNKHLPMTEERLHALGDAPNVTVTWLLFGWIPILATSLLTSIYSSKTSHKEPAQSPPQDA